MMSFPNWTATGILPPIRPDVAGADPDRSPYVSTIADVVSRFATSNERCQILDGLLRYRAALHALDLKRGFQWLDGSFMENVELSQNRPPNDIDVVTFFHLPDGVASQQELFKEASQAFQDEKKQFHVDAYYVQLGEPMSRFEVGYVSYWYSMWSHRRDQVWKGYLQIDLDPAFDGEARANLGAIAAEGSVA